MYNVASLCFSCCRCALFTAQHNGFTSDPRREDWWPGGQVRRTERPVQDVLHHCKKPTNCSKNSSVLFVANFDFVKLLNHSLQGCSDDLGCSQPVQIDYELICWGVNSFRKEQCFFFFLRWFNGNLIRGWNSGQFALVWKKAVCEARGKIRWFQEFSFLCSLLCFHCWVTSWLCSIFSLAFSFASSLNTIFWIYTESSWWLNGKRFKCCAHFSARRRKTNKRLFTLKTKLGLILRGNETQKNNNNNKQTKTKKIGKNEHSRSSCEEIEAKCCFEKPGETVFLLVYSSCCEKKDKKWIYKNCRENCRWEKIVNTMVCGWSNLRDASNWTASHSPKSTNCDRLPKLSQFHLGIF